MVKYINSSGAVLKSYEYDAFGEETNASATDANPFRYAGQYFDAVKIGLGVAGNSIISVGSSYVETKITSQQKKLPMQTHHFASNKNSKFTKQFESIVSKYGLDLDDDWNKSLMPHQGRHPNAYHQYVLDNMIKFDQIAKGDVNKFLKLFNSMKETIIKNPEMLRKAYWEN